MKQLRMKKVPDFKVLALAGLLAAMSGGAFATGVDELPADIRARLYASDMMDPAQPLGPSAYRDWKPKKGPPWTIGYASSYAGNTWRAAVMDRLQNELIPKWKKLGLIKEVIITQSNLKDATQIQQMRQLIIGLETYRNDQSTRLREHYNSQVGFGVVVTEEDRKNFGQIISTRCNESPF